MYVVIVQSCPAIICLIDLNIAFGAIALAKFRLFGTIHVLCISLYYRAPAVKELQNILLRKVSSGDTPILFTIELPDYGAAGAMALGSITWGLTYMYVTHSRTQGCWSYRGLSTRKCHQGINLLILCRAPGYRSCRGLGAIARKSVTW